MLPPLPDRAIRINAQAADWRAAVRVSGDALRQAGSTTGAYYDRMIGMIEQYGAYVVIAPGLALAHARPGPDVKHTGLSVVTLVEPVAFGHPHNDPVEVVIGLAVRDGDEHVGIIAELANVFNDPAVIPALAAAEDGDSVRSLLGVGSE